MKLISWNINGLKAKLESKKLQDLVAEQKPDLLCLQEVKTTKFPRELHALGFKNILHNTQKQISGVMTLCNLEVVADKKCEFADDNEARVCESHFDDFVLFNIYFPLGDKELDYKLKFYNLLQPVSYIFVKFSDLKNLLRQPIKNHLG